MNYWEIELVNAWYIKARIPSDQLYRISYRYLWGRWDYRFNKYIKSIETDYLYETWIGDGVCIFQIGFASYLFNEYHDEWTEDSLNLLESILFNDKELPEFINLRSNQNLDIQQLFLLNRGLFQCYTSYGKTEIIVTLAHYISTVLNDKVLVVTSNNTPLNELRSRYSRLYNKSFDYFNYDDNLNLINLNGFLKSSWYDKDADYWKDLKWILSDEVENCVNDTAMEFYESLPSVTHMYGFSATADKNLANPIYSKVIDGMTSNEVKDTLGRNKWLVGYYGTTVVFKKPIDYRVKLIYVTTSLTLSDYHLSSDIEYSEITLELFTNNKLCRLIESIATSKDLIYIPMFRLQVIDYWIENYFKIKDYLIAVISSRGYELYENGVYLDNISIDELKELVSNGSIRLILGTKSSYGALDLPELNKCLLLFSKQANVVIQAIGRAARVKNVEIYNIKPYEKLPIYSSDLNSRISLIKQYYSESLITESTLDENYLIKTG